MPSRYTYQTRNLRAIYNRIASIPLLRPAHEVLGWSDAQKAAFCLTRDRNNLACSEKHDASACAFLGRANKHRHARKFWSKNLRKAVIVGDYIVPAPMPVRFRPILDRMRPRASRPQSRSEKNHSAGAIADSFTPARQN